MIKKLFLTLSALAAVTGLLIWITPYVQPNQPTRAQQLKQDHYMRPSPRLNNIFNGMSEGFNK